MDSKQKQSLLLFRNVVCVLSGKEANTSFSHWFYLIVDRTHNLAHATSICKVAWHIIHYINEAVNSKEKYQNR